MLLILKLVLTPVLTLLLTFAGRRWGERVSGIVAGLPLNSGPISFLFALEYGNEFAAQAGIGSMGGMAGIAAFALVYAHMARRYAWYVCAPLAIAVFFVLLFALDATDWALLPTVTFTLASLLLAQRFAPRTQRIAEPLKPPRWDLPLRLVSATAFVLIITALGTVLGARLGGLAATFPIFAVVMTVFAHRHQGAEAAIQWLRGILAGLYAAVAFYIVISLAMDALPLLATYALAILAALGVNGFTLHRTRAL